MQKYGWVDEPMFSIRLLCWNTAVPGVRSNWKSHPMNNRRCSGHPQKMVPLALRRFQLGARIIIYVAKEHEKKPDEYWQHILWSKETKINLFGSDGVRIVWCGPGQDQWLHTVQITRKRSGRVLIRGYETERLPGKMTCIDGAINFSKI